MNVSVVYGGTKEERDASYKNAKDIAEVLKERGYRAILIPFEHDIINTLRRESTDVVYLCVQGKGYGDGTLQGILEHEKISFTGSGMRAASLINDKILCKLLFDKYDISTPKWRILGRKDYENGDFSFDASDYPFVAKAPTQGGSFGIELIRSREDLPNIGKVFEYDDPLLIEDYIDGRFFTVGLYESNGKLITLPVVEGIDLEKKEKETGGDLISFTGAYSARESSLDDKLAGRMEDMARKVFEITGARALARVDFMVDANLVPYVLEINAVPGLKRASLMPKEAMIAGIDYADMIEDILKAAL